MAQQGDLERRCSDKASKIQAAVRGFVGSLSEILTEEDLFEEETNVIGSVLRQTETELKNRMEQLRRLRTDTPSRVAASGFERDDNLAGSSVHSKKARQRCAYPEGEVGICRHFCRDHRELMDLSLWETLPAEVVERICAMLPLSKILKLLKLCEPWSRLPTATRFRQLCAKAHGDLFGIVMFSEKSLTYQLAMYDSKYEEWSHLELSNIPPDYMNFLKISELLFGHDGGLMCVIPHDFYFHEEPPCILVFNPLTGDKKYIGVSSFIASFDNEEVYVVLLQLIMDGELGCYKLILVMQRTKPRAGGVVYYSESYDSMSGVWSTLDSGFVYGDGVFWDTHYPKNCKLKKFYSPAQYGTSVRNPHSHVYSTNVHHDYTMANPANLFDVFVRDHRFKLKLESVEEIETNEMLSFKAEILESVWLNGWNEKSKISLAMPHEDFEARLLACTHYLLVIADGGRYAESEDCHQHMALYDRVNCEETALNVPQFMIEEFQGDEHFMDHSLQFMCDLKWDAVP